MKTRRFAGFDVQEDISGHSLATQTVLGLYPELLRELPVGVVLLMLEDSSDPESFRIVDANRAAGEIARPNSPRLLGRSLADFPKLRETPIPAQLLDTLRSGESRNLGEISYGDELIRQGIYSVRAFPLSNNFLGVAFDDVTDRINSERTLRESEERFRLLVEGVQEYAIFQLDSEGNVVSWNAGAQRLKGYDSAEIIGHHFSIFYPREDQMNNKPRDILARARRQGRTEDEGWRIRKDGSRFWANVVITALRDANGNLLGFAKLTRDTTENRERAEALTRAKELLELRVEQRTAVLMRVNHEMRTEIAERQRAEEELRKSRDQLRALAGRLQSVREEERTYIAREIHDELGQACTAIKMDLALISRKLTKRQTKLLAKIESSIHLVDSTIVTLRRIASELRPRTLDDLGLPAALEAQAQEFESRTGIPCSVSLPPDALTLDTERSTAIFRIFQESLTNVARHAQATRVEASLRRERDRIIFQVSDNGTGFDPEVAKAGKSLGLVGMQERALLLNGEFKTEGVPGSGTTMTLTIPLAPSTAAESVRHEDFDR
ncbi:MAG TPA: PAS domain-containing sensor histidine kinase [Candidatus Acidoferrum sp.]|nr:PAS domain-containing sensor histidine kinase [Candidatus Acidoferrum sp.]